MMVCMMMRRFNFGSPLNVGLSHRFVMGVMRLIGMLDHTRLIKRRSPLGMVASLMLCVR